MCLKVMTFTFLVLSTQAIFAQSYSERKSPYKKAYKKSKRKVKRNYSPLPSQERDTWELNLALGSQKFKSDDGFEDGDSNIVRLQMGYIFNITDSFSTTTSGAAALTVVSQSEIDKANINDSDVVIENSRLLDIGITQKFSYAIESTLGVFKPFIQAGISRGAWETLMTSPGDTGEITYELNYEKVHTAAGIELHLEGGIVPFAMYSRDKYTMDETGTLSGNINGTPINASGTTDDRNTEASAISVGLGVTF